MYFVGGAARAGKTILGHRIASNLRIGWISTDLLLTLLGMANVAGIKTEWNATPEALTANAEWFFPYLERFVWGVYSMAEHYVIEGVDFLPAQVARLAAQYEVRAVFLGRSRMTPVVIDHLVGAETANGLAFSCRERAARDGIKKSTISRAKRSDYNAVFAPRVQAVCYSTAPELVLQIVGASSAA